MQFVAGGSTEVGFGGAAREGQLWQGTVYCRGQFGPTEVPAGEAERDSGGGGGGRRRADTERQAGRRTTRGSR